MNNISHLIYVFHKHHASHLHYDLRLEINGVLWSWAVPKEPPTIPGVKRLAIRVEDHPLDYATFEGVIPDGQYGAGKVEIWDNGTFHVVQHDEKKLVVMLHGKKLTGEYCLLHLDKKQWLFFKMETQ